MKYVNGFMFSEDYKKVLLIKKNKPSWQKGLLNGIGGKVEGDENYHKAMTREFSEEVGIDHDNWDLFLDYNIKDEHKILFFVCSSNKLYEFERMEEEEPIIINVCDLNDYRFVDNLSFIVPLALWFYKNKSYMKDPVILKES